MQKIKFIYFDFGGVLVNYKNAFRRVCADFNLDFEDFWGVYHELDDDLAHGRITTDDFWKRCIEKYNLKNADSYDLAKWWVSDYKTIKETSELIYSVSQKIKVGIISNICEGPWEAALKYGYVPQIDYKKIFLSYKEKMAKPNRDIYEKVQRESMVKPEEILFVDDKEENLLEPQKLGWKTVLFDEFNAEDGVKKIKEIIY